jgi:hypothetical protein
MEFLTFPLRDVLALLAIVLLEQELGAAAAGSWRRHRRTRHEASRNVLVPGLSQPVGFAARGEELFIAQADGRVVRTAACAPGTRRLSAVPAVARHWFRPRVPLV